MANWQATVYGWLVVNEWHKWHYEGICMMKAAIGDDKKILSW